MKIVESGITGIINLLEVVDILPRRGLHGFAALFKAVSALPDTPVQIENPIYLGVAYSPAEGLSIQRLVAAIPYLQAGVYGSLRIALSSLGVHDVEKIVKRTSQIVKKRNLRSWIVQRRYLAFAPESALRIFILPKPGKVPILPFSRNFPVEYQSGIDTRSLMRVQPGFLPPLQIIEKGLQLFPLFQRMERR